MKKMSLCLVFTFFAAHPAFAVPERPTFPSSSRTACNEAAVLPQYLEWLKKSLVYTIARAGETLDESKISIRVEYSRRFDSPETHEIYWNIHLTVEMVTENGTQLDYRMEGLPFFPYAFVKIHEVRKSDRVVDALGNVSTVNHRRECTVRGYKNELVSEPDEYPERYAVVYPVLYNAHSGDKAPVSSELPSPEFSWIIRE